MTLARCVITAPPVVVTTLRRSGSPLISLAFDRSTVPTMGLVVWKMLGRPRSRSSLFACTACTA